MIKYFLFPGPHAHIIRNKTKKYNKTKSTERRRRRGAYKRDYCGDELIGMQGHIHQLYHVGG